MVMQKMGEIDGSHAKLSDSSLGQEGIAGRTSGNLLNDPGLMGIRGGQSTPSSSQQSRGLSGISSSLKLGTSSVGGKLKGLADPQGMRRNTSAS